MKELSEKPRDVIPYGRHSISEADIEAVTEVLRSNWLTQGPLVPKFEDSLAYYTRATAAVALNSATAALHVACLALEVGPGDKVWTSPITFVASANCALYCGASVDFVDIDAGTYNMSVDSLAEKLRQARLIGCLPKVVIPVHLCGQSCDMEAIYTLSREYGFRIIEDASHAIGGHYLGQPIGSCRYSDITVFSFHPVKIITTGEGGMATTNDPLLAKRMRQYRSHGITFDNSEMDARDAFEIWNYQQISLGFNYRMTDIQAALGLSQAVQLDEFVRARHQVAAIYNQALSELPLTLPYQHPSTFSSYHLYPIRIDPVKCNESQQDVYRKLNKAGVLVNIHYIPVYRHPYYERLGFQEGYCPEAERYYREAISLPMYPTLSATQQRLVIGALKEALVS